MELVRLGTGMNLVHVPYKAVSQAQTDLISGQLQTMFMVPVTAIPQSQAGRLHILAAAGGRRFSQLPDVPTLAEEGLKGFDVMPWVGMMGPVGMRPDMVRRISNDVAKALGTEEARQRALTLGLEVASKGHEEMETFVVRDKDHWAELVRRSGARVDSYNDEASAHFCSRRGLLGDGLGHGFRAGVAVQAHQAHGGLSARRWPISARACSSNRFPRC